MTSNTGLNFSRVMPIFVLTFVDVLGLTIILPLLHLYAAAFGASPLEIGLVAAAFPLSQLIGVPVMGALSDRYGRKPLLLISQITTCISFLMLAGANSLSMVILSRIVDGLFGANLSTAQAAITDLTDESNRAQGLGLTGAAFGLGFIIGPAIALFSLEVSDSLGTPALIAAAYSFVSILLTLFSFRETLPPERRGQMGKRLNVLTSSLNMMRRPQINWLLALMFSQQIVFFAFESLLGLFTLSRLGLLGQGNALVFIFVGFVLVWVQVRLIGRLSRKYGERKLVLAALAFLAIGLIFIAFTPEQPHPFYIRNKAQHDLEALAPDATEAIIGQIDITLPTEDNRGIGGLLWFLVGIVPVSVGAGLIRPGLNSLMTKRVSRQEYGTILGLSAAFVSLANAAAPLLGGLIFQMQGSSAPFAIGGVVMTILLLISAWGIQSESMPSAGSE
ncbi:MAG: MFS transporter [Anaerolineae bacterium]|nr:MFS transporter [Anaerolineae bacterium]